MPSKQHKRQLEQDYWLSFLELCDWSGEATEEQREEFFRYDSQGGTISPTNPILMGKRRHGWYLDSYQSAYEHISVGEWYGGAYEVQEFIGRRPYGTRPLRDQFGDEAVMRWLEAAWYMTGNRSPSEDYLTGRTPFWACCAVQQFTTEVELK